MTKPKIRPFLKWPGRKFNIMPELVKYFPKPEKNAVFVEPFLGSGAVFLNTQYHNYILNDSNSDLINVYLYLIKEGEKFIKYCKTFFTPENNSRERYYELRDLFNRSKATRKKAALFIYLNRHGYNGLCRYNNSGGYNVPFGRYKSVNLLHREMLDFYNKANNCNVKFTCSDFTECLNHVPNNSIIYCDPPYVPLSHTASFTRYSKSEFNFKHQEKLVEMIIGLKAKNILSIISNHDLPLTRELYKDFELVFFDVKRNISCKTDYRNYVKELLAMFNH